MRGWGGFNRRNKRGKFQIPSSKFQRTSNIEHRTSNIEHPTPNMQHNSDSGELEDLLVEVTRRSSWRDDRCVVLQERRTRRRSSSRFVEFAIQPGCCLTISREEDDLSELGVTFGGETKHGLEHIRSRANYGVSEAGRSRERIGRPSMNKFCEG